MREFPLLPRQRCAFIFVAASAPLVTVSARLPWPLVAAVLLLTLALLTGLGALEARAGVLWPRAAKTVWGNGLGGAILVLQLLFAAVYLWQLALATDSAFPEQQTLPFVPLTLLAVCALAAGRGRETCVRAVGVLFLFLVALYGAVFAFAAPDVELSRLTALPAGGDLLPLGVVALLPFFSVALPSSQGKIRLPVLWMLVFVLLPTAAAAFCAAVPGSRGSLYDMAKSVEVFSVARRIEPLVSCGLTIGWFAALCLTAVFAGAAAQGLGLSFRAGAVGVCVPASLGSFVDIALPPGLLLSVGAVFCVLLPILTQGIVCRKKGVKKAKKGVDKG